MKKPKLFILILIFFTISAHCLLSQDDVWNRIQPTPQEHSLFCIRQIPGTETLVTVGRGSTIMYSDDAGDTWDITIRPAGLPNNTWFLSVKFYDEQNGYAVTNNGKIIRTTDGGQNWELVYDNVIDTIIYTERTDIYVFDPQTAIAILYNQLIVKTDDGGETWDPIDIPCSSGLTQVRFLDDWHGFVFGNNGVIMETLTGGVVGNEEDHFTANEQLFTVSPNPFSNQIKIEITDPYAGKTTIDIFNMKGERIYKNSFNGNVTANEIMLNLSAYPPGIYFCRVVQGNKMSSRKIVKM
ncbi:MAG: T9SS type A sorting domain-containing protein [Chlorobi bacterium]|nr:T9SS type A sorting domain-containing protein [Chlorobiota bacterium]